MHSRCMSSSMMAGGALDAVRARLTLKDSEVKRILKQVPAVGDCSFNDAALTALQTRLSLSDAELKAIVLRLPQVLCYDDYDTSMAPSLDAVQARLQLTDSELAFMVKKLPQMIGLDFASAIEPNLAAVQQEGGLTVAALKETLLARPSELLKAGVVVRGGTVGPKGKAARSGTTTMMADAKVFDEAKSEAVAATDESPGSTASAADDDDNEPSFGGVPVFELALLAAVAYATFIEPTGGGAPLAPPGS